VGNDKFCWAINGGEEIARPGRSSRKEKDTGGVKELADRKKTQSRKGWASALLGEGRGKRGKGLTRTRVEKARTTGKTKRLSDTSTGAEGEGNWNQHYVNVQGVRGSGQRRAGGKREAFGGRIG